MAKDSAKKPLPKPADVPSAAPFITRIERAKARFEKVATPTGGDEGSSPDGARVRGAKKRVKRAQRRLRRELHRAAAVPAPAAPTPEPAAPASDGGDAAPTEADAG